MYGGRETDRDREKKERGPWALTGVASSIPAEASQLTCRQYIIGKLTLSKALDCVRRTVSIFTVFILCHSYCVIQ